MALPLGAVDWSAVCDCGIRLIILICFFGSFLEVRHTKKIGHRRPQVKTPKLVTTKKARDDLDRQLVSSPDQCSEGSELKQQNLSGCMPAYLSACMFVHCPGCLKFEQSKSP